MLLLLDSLLNCVVCDVMPCCQPPKTVMTTPTMMAATTLGTEWAGHLLESKALDLLVSRLAGMRW